MKHLTITVLALLLSICLAIMAIQYSNKQQQKTSTETILAKMEHLNRLESVTFYLNTLITKQHEQEFVPFGLADKKCSM